MHDDTKTQLTAALDAEGATPWPDLEWVLRRGSRLRIVRSITIVFVTVAVLGAAAGSASLLNGSGASEIPRPAGPDGPPPPAPDEVAEDETLPPLVEDTSEQQQAEIFAFRALAATGVMTPLGEHTYTWMSSDHTERVGEAWSIAFASADCAPRDGPEGLSQTCRQLTGEEGQDGNPRAADAFVRVQLEGDVWRVVGMEGVIRADHRERVVGFELRREVEPSHWELPAISIWRMSDGTSAQMWPLWVGPYPTDAPGSVCELHALDEDGRPFGRPTVYYMEPPRNAYDRMGWVHGRGIDGVDDFAGAKAECRQYTGRGWEIESGPDLIAHDNEILSVTAGLVWRGERGFTASARCRATLVDEDGATVWEGSAEASPLWRPDQLRHYPYRTHVTVNTGGEPIRADRIGEFGCETH